jgi:hypothetical protein
MIVISNLTSITVYRYYTRQRDGSTLGNDLVKHWKAVSVLLLRYTIDSGLCQDQITPKSSCITCCLVQISIMMLGSCRSVYKPTLSIGTEHSFNRLHAQSTSSSSSPSLQLSSEAWHVPSDIASKLLALVVSDSPDFARALKSSECLILRSVGTLCAHVSVTSKDVALHIRKLVSQG